MNHDKYNITVPETGSICELGSSTANNEARMHYDETDLLSKMFTKDH